MKLTKVEGFGDVGKSYDGDALSDPAVGERFVFVYEDDWGRPQSIMTTPVREARDGKTAGSTVFKTEQSVYSLERESPGGE